MKLLSFNGSVEFYMCLTTGLCQIFGGDYDLTRIMMTKACDQNVEMIKF